MFAFDNSMFRVGFSVDATLFTITNLTFNFQTAVLCATTHILKHCQIHVHPFWVKLNTLLTALTGHFDLKVSRNLQEAGFFQ